MASGLRSVFFGTPEFAAHILRDLVEHGENIVGVVTTPAKPSGRGMKLHESDVERTGKELNIPVLAPTKHRDQEFLDQLKIFNADVFIVVAYKILPKEVFSMPRLGTFNIHASLLPKYRGAAPINWAIIRGEKETGITTFLLQEKVDTGNILLARSVSIGPDETAGELHDRLMVLGAELARHTLAGLAHISLHPTPQSSDLGTDAPKIFPKDCIVNFDQDRDAIHNFIRGLSPYPGAVAEIAGHRLKLLRSYRAAIAPSGIKTGSVHVSHDRKHLFIGTGTEAIEILELQREGKRPMGAEEFLRGAHWL